MTNVAPKEELGLLLQFNLVKVEIRKLRPEVVTEDDELLVHYQSRTNVTVVIF